MLLGRQRTLCMRQASQARLNCCSGAETPLEPEEFIVSTSQWLDQSLNAFLGRVLIWGDKGDVKSSETLGILSKGDFVGTSAYVLYKATVGEWLYSPIYTKKT